MDNELLHQIVQSIDTMSLAQDIVDTLYAHSLPLTLANSLAVWSGIASSGKLSELMHRECIVLEESL